MPIGIPKVAYRLPGEPSAQWVDLYNRLYRDRVLFLCQPLDDEVANQLIGIMLYLNAEDETKGLFLYINSPGGALICGIGVYDSMHYVEADVTTISVGTSSSMASFVLSGGEPGKRIALPSSRIMIHQPEGGSKGQAEQVVLEADEVERLRREVCRLYAERTGQPRGRIWKDMDRDQFMSSREARAYGLVDLVAVG